VTWYASEPKNGLTRADVQHEIRDFVRSPSLVGSIVPGSIPHRGVNTARSRIYYSPTAVGNYTISATSMAEVDGTNLAGTITCSGAPVLLMASVRAAGAGATGTIALGFTFDGAAPDGQDSGAWATDYTGFVGASFFVEIPTPRAGTRRYALTAMRATANGIVYSGGGNSIELLAMEF